MITTKKTDRRTTERLLRAAKELTKISGAATLPKEDASALSRMSEVLERMFQRLEKRERAAERRRQT